MSDITSLLRPILAAKPSVPIYLMGHSMGGGEVLYYASHGPTEIVRQLRGVIASAPLIALDPLVRPWKTTNLAARAAEKIMPNFHIVNHLGADLMSRDKEANDAWVADPLCHDTGTLEGLVGMFDRSEALDNRNFRYPDRVNEGEMTRLLIAHGTDDHVNSFQASKLFLERCQGGDVLFKPYEGRRHCSEHLAVNIVNITSTDVAEVHLDTGYEGFREDVADWMLQRCDLSAQPGTASQASTSRL